MPTPDRLAALVAAQIAAIAPTGARWDAAMRKAITQAQVAAYIAGAAERLGVKPDSALLNPRNLSRAERADITQAVDAQLKYLAGFDRTGMSEAQIRARMQLYAGAERTLYYAARWGDWEIPQELLPGAQQCGGRCKCDGAITDNGDGTGLWTRTMHGDEGVHCTECPPLAGDHSVKRRKA